MTFKQPWHTKFRRKPRSVICLTDSMLHETSGTCKTQSKRKCDKLTIGTKHLDLHNPFTCCLDCPFFTESHGGTGQLIICFKHSTLPGHGTGGTTVNDPVLPLTLCRVLRSYQAVHVRSHHFTIFGYQLGLMFKPGMTLASVTLNSLKGVSTFTRRSMMLGLAECSAPL